LLPVERARWPRYSKVESGSPEIMLSTIQHRICSRKKVRTNDKKKYVQIIGQENSRK